jgi:type VI protein secretion system component VasF
MGKVRIIHVGDRSANVTSPKDKTPNDKAAVLSECASAVDHLRNALDALPPNSALAHALLGIVRRLADFVDAANASKLFRR